MITEIELENYRGFSKHKISLRPVSIIVGRNNSGKSTIIEALKLISIVVSRAPKSTFISPPNWIDFAIAARGISPSIRGIDFEFRNLCHQYGAPPAIIKAKFEGNKYILIFINSEFENLFAVLRRGTHTIINNSQASIFINEIINVMPPIGQIQIRERILRDNYVKSNLNTRLSALHFRNQLFFLGNDYDETSGTESDEYESISLNPSRFQAFVRLGHIPIKGIHKRADM